MLSTNHGLFLLRPGRAAQPFANGPGGYTAGSGEPYVALASGSRVWGVAGCSFEPDDVFALDAGSTPGIIRVRQSGQASRFLDLPPGAFPSGIAFDRFGRFGYRLLVTATFENNTRTTLYAIDCLARLSVIAQGPHVEGGIVVAPPSFGRFGGELIAADENSGRIYAFGRDGAAELVADSGLPAGGDIGVEALGFVPTRIGRGAAAYFSDLGAPGSPTRGTTACSSCAARTSRAPPFAAASSWRRRRQAGRRSRSAATRPAPSGGWRTGCPPRTAKATSRSSPARSHAGSGHHSAAGTSTRLVVSRRPPYFTTWWSS